MFPKPITDYLISNDYKVLEELDTQILYKCGPINVLVKGDSCEMFSNCGDFVFSTVPFKPKTQEDFSRREKNFIHNYFNLDI